MFEDAALEVGHRAKRVGVNRGVGVLCHHQSVLVVKVGEHKGVAWQGVEEGFLGAEVGIDGLVVVKMVAGEVGEDSSCEGQPADAVLGDGVRRALHKGVLAAFVGHTAEQTVEGDGIGRSVVGGDGLVVDVVADGAEQACLVSEGTEHLVEQRGNGGLAVGACDAHKTQAARGIAEERGGYGSDGGFAVGYTDVGDTFSQRVGQGLAEDGGRAVCDGLVDVGVSVHLGAADGGEECPRGDLSGVYSHICHKCRGCPACNLVGR